MQSIRSLIEYAHIKEHDGTKVIIVDDAHRLMTVSSNALLKTIEEPIDDTVIILVADKSSSIPDTILSRCHKYFFDDLDNQTMCTFLEQIGCDTNNLEQINRFACGIPLFAKTLSEKKDVYERIGKLLGLFTLNQTISTSLSYFINFDKAHTKAKLEFEKLHKHENMKDLTSFQKEQATKHIDSLWFQHAALEKNIVLRNILDMFTTSIFLIQKTIRN